MLKKYGNLETLKLSVILPWVANKQRQNFWSGNACILSLDI